MHDVPDNVFLRDPLLVPFLDRAHGLRRLPQFFDDGQDRRFPRLPMPTIVRPPVDNLTLPIVPNPNHVPPQRLEREKVRRLGRLRRPSGPSLCGETERFHAHGVGVDLLGRGARSVGEEEAEVFGLVAAGGVEGGQNVNASLDPEDVASWDSSEARHLQGDRQVTFREESTILRPPITFCSV